VEICHGRIGSISLQEIYCDSVFGFVFQPNLTIRSDVDLLASCNNIDVRFIERFLRLLLGSGM